MSNEFANKILAALEEQHVTPKSRWSFLLLHSLLWASAGFVVLLGSLCFAATLAIVSTADWDLADQLEQTPIGLGIMAIPPLWIILLILFLLLADYNIRHTQRGYQLSLTKITAAVVGLSVLCGVFFYAIGVGTTVDREIGEHMPYYHQIGNRRTLYLLQPERGVLAGVIKDMNDENAQWHVIDATQHAWLVDTAEATIIGGDLMMVGRHIRIVGTQYDDNTKTFIAHQIIPLRPPAEFRGKIDSLRKQYPASPTPPPRQRLILRAHEQ